MAGRRKEAGKASEVASSGKNPSIQTEIAKRPVGRPSKYDPAYCDQIVSFCSEGYSITGFAGSIGVSRECIEEWRRKYPEFSVACGKAKAAATHAYEVTAKKIREEGGGPGSATITLFGLKNFAPDDYRDQQNVSHSGPNGSPIEVNTSVVDARSMTPEEREAMRQILLAARARKEAE